jgi:hypothetical protein
MLCAELQIQIGPFILQLSQQDRILYCPEFGLLSYISEATTDIFFVLVFICCDCEHIFSR